jgi:sugar phosphate isomerase/epimerase
MAHLTLGWLTLINATAAQVIDAAAAAQFRSVSLRITGRKLSDPFTDIVGDKAALRDLKQRLDDQGLRLSNLSSYHLTPEITLDHLRPVIDGAVALGCDTMVATCSDPDHARWADFMRRYCAAADQAGIRIALEFVPFSEARGVATAVALVAAIGAGNFGILVDSLHLSRSGGSPADLQRIDPARIFFAQLCDAVAMHPPRDSLAHEARTGRLYPGDGALPLDDFVAALPAGVEIECEAPILALAGLSPAEQARRAGSATRAFLDRYFAARAKPNPYA